MEAEEKVKLKCDLMREIINTAGMNTLELKKLIINDIDGRDDGGKSEMVANTVLAYRHLEDARMRLGKVLQAMEGGVSCYDHPVSDGGS